MITLGRACPRCRGTKIYQSHSRWYDLPFRILLLIGVRCGECDQRFLRPRFFEARPRNSRRSVVSMREGRTA